MNSAPKPVATSDVMKFVDRLMRAGEIDKADQIIGELIGARPLLSRSLSLAAQVKQRKHDLISADKLARKAIISRPEYWPLYANYSKVCAFLSQIDKSITLLTRCSLMAVEQDAIQTQLGLLYLCKGHLQKGLCLYETRGSRRTFEQEMAAIGIPVWQGQAVAGKKFLLVAEQGAGDVIQFSRFAQVLADRGAHVTISCEPNLWRILRSAPSVTAVIGRRITEFDYAELMMSVPLKLGLNDAQMNSDRPYLFAPQDGHRLADTGRLRVGLCWAGNPLHENDWARSIAVEQFVPLLAINGIDFYSLQVGQQAASFNPEKTPLIDLSQHLKDFADTPAVLAQLDLVISVDSSVAHLAGALGKPVWTLLSLSAEWRWAGATGQSPLYPDMQLFWQPEFGDWTTVIDQVCDALKAKLKP